MTPPKCSEGFKRANIFLVVLSSFHKINYWLPVRVHVLICRTGSSTWGKPTSTGWTSAFPDSSMQIGSKLRLQQTCPLTYQAPSNWRILLAFFSCVSLPLQKRWMVTKAKSKQKWACADSALLHSENLAAILLQHRLCEDMTDNTTDNLHLTALLQFPGLAGIRPSGRAPDGTHAGADGCSPTSPRRFLARLAQEAVGTLLSFYGLRSWLLSLTWERSAAKAVKWLLYKPVLLIWYRL